MPEHSSSESVRTAVVTGASSGLGAATAAALGALGWQVAVGARRMERLEETARTVEARGGKALAHELDVAKPDSIETFFTAVEDHFGPADVIINNAGMSHPGPIHTLSTEELAHEVGVNLTGSIYVTRRALQTLLKTGSRGDIVFISSDASRHPRPHQTIYTATKAGLEGFSSALAMELEGSGIRTCVVRPGPTLSEYASSWGIDLITGLLEYWQHYGLQRHMGTMPAEAIAQAVVNAVTTPQGIRIDLVEVQPEAPKPIL